MLQKPTNDWLCLNNLQNADYSRSRQRLPEKRLIYGGEKNHSYKHKFAALTP